MVGTLLERDAALASIEAALETARAGRGAALFVIAEAGLGKTSLLEASQTEAVRDFDVAIARGDAAEATLPFGVISQAREAAPGSRPAEALPRLDLNASDARGAYFYATLRWLQRRKRALLLLFDDLHWADRDSLSLLAFICRRIASLPVAIIGTLRPWPPDAMDTVDRLLASGAATAQRLAPLSEGSATSVLTARLGLPVPENRLREVFALCGGNPFLLEQAALLLERDGVLDPDIVGALNGQARLLLARFGGLTETELRYAQAASVFGTRFRSSLVHLVADLSARQGNRALEALSRAGLVRQANGWSEFVHPLVTHVLYENLPGPVRTRSHAAAFQVLAGCQVDPAEAAEQAVRGKLVGDPAVVEMLERAGRRALETGALRRARELLDHAVDLAGEVVPPSVLLAQGDTLLSSGDPQAAIPMFRRVLAVAELAPAARVSARHGLARALSIAGSTAEADKQYTAAAEEALKDDPERALAIMLDQTQGNWLSGGAGHALAIIDHARTIAKTAGPSARDRVAAVWAFCAFHMGDPSGIDVLRAAALRAEADPLHELTDLAWSLGTFGTYLLVARFTEQFAEADRLFRIGYQAAERAGLPTAIAVLAVSHSDALWRVGRIEEALSRVTRASELIELSPLLAVWDALGLTVLLYELGRADESWNAYQRTEALGAVHQGRLPILWIWLGHQRARFHIDAGRLNEAAAAYEQVERIADQGEIFEPCIVPWARDAIETYLACDRPDDARRVLASVEAVAERLPCRWPKVVIATSRARFAEREGDRARADSLFVDALRLHAQMEMPLAEAETVMLHGRFLRRGRELRRARSAFARALAISERVGAGRLAELARAELWAAGGRQRKQRLVDELTPQEMRVAQLAREGLTDKQIARRLTISAKTVEAHLQHIYRKLEVSSRRELMLQRELAINRP